MVGWVEPVSEFNLLGFAHTVNADGHLGLLTGETQQIKEGMYRSTTTYDK